MENFQLLINGKWKFSNSKEVFPVVNPANEAIIGYAQKANEVDAIEALVSASEAFKEWSRLTYKDRELILYNAVEIIEKRANLIAELLTMEQGKPFNQAKSEVLGAAEVIKYFIEEGKRVYGEIIPPNKANCRNFIIKQPIGVCIAISPWNYPVGLLSWKIGPALITGCTVVTKPSSLTPLSPIKFIECFKDAGLPNGVLNIITGPGNSVGRELIKSDISKKIALTGSSSTGKKVMELSSKKLKRISLELGNNAPLIVCKDADIITAAKAACKKSFDNMGQVCNSINRIYLENSISEQFMEKFIEFTKKLKISNGLENREADLGPMVDDSQRKLVMDHIQDAKGKGAKIVFGGEIPSGKEYNKGYYFMPTILTNVNHDMRIMKEETFGPVAPIMIFKDFMEAINLANDTTYGLVAYVFTNNLGNIIYASDELEYGTVDINNVSGGHPPYPYGGWKESGIGIELSHYGIEEYLRVKHIRLTIN